jgi:hypothetical protein
MERAQKPGMLLCEPIFVPKGPKIRGSGGVLADARFSALPETGQVKKSEGKKSGRKEQPDAADCQTSFSRVLLWSDETVS